MSCTNHKPGMVIGNVFKIMEDKLYMYTLSGSKSEVEREIEDRLRSRPLVCHM